MVEMTEFTGKIYVNAIGVSSGGGLRLLEALFTQLEPQKKYHFFLDARLNVTPPSQDNLTWEMLSPAKGNRVAFEKRLSHMIDRDDTLFCFNNIPPLFANSGQTIVFLQNRHILQPFVQKGLAIKEQARLALSWLIFKKNSSYVDKFIVQTPAMKRLLGKNHNVEVVPFLPEMPELKYQRTRPQVPSEFDFFYPSEAFVHKNHERLLKAWHLLSQKGIAPKLKLTAKHDDLNERAQKLIKDHSLNIEFLGSLDYKQMFEQYLSSDALIFPSLCESFGLPLLEAQHVGLPIIASNREYVTDVVTSVAMFDPLDPSSIENEISHFIENVPTQKVQRKFLPQNVMATL